MNHEKINTILINLIILILLYGKVYCEPYDNMDSKMNSLIQQISDLDKQINLQIKKKTNLDLAISNSNLAIDKTNNFIEFLKKKQDITKSQLNQLNLSLNTIKDQTAEITNQMKIVKVQLYYQLKKLQSNSSTLISGNDKTNNIRNQVYLIQILKLAQKKYMVLQNRIIELDKSNDNLQSTIISLDKNIKQYQKIKDKLVKQDEIAIQKDKSIHDAIFQEKNQVIKLEQQRQSLNKLIKSLANKPKNTNKQVFQRNSPTENITSNTLNGLKIVTPINSKPFVLFNQIYNNSKSNGILYKSTNENVFSILNGVVKYTGELPGFGSVIVVNYKDNYVAIYAGVLSKVNKNDKVRLGQIIATSGKSSNQPMGGVYFELRHWGVPVNPNNLINK